MSDQTIRLQSETIPGGGMPGPHLLITGGVHGDEFEPMVALRRLIRELREQAASIRGRVTLVPVVNESAFLRGHRTGDDGLDLARFCPGRADGKPTERVAHALSELIRSANYYIDLHTGGTTLAVLPMVGYTLHPDAQVLAKQRLMARAFNLPIIWGTTPTLNGRSLSVARDANVPAIYAEYGGSGVCDPSGVNAYVEGCLNVMSDLGMIDRTAPTPSVVHVVEDDRPESGHMQVNNPSPVTGFFEPAVRLGDRVNVGNPLGVVTDPLGTRVEAVTSKQDGVVLVLKTFPKVEKGETLAVILETDRQVGANP